MLNQLRALFFIFLFAVMGCGNSPEPPIDLEVNPRALTISAGSPPVALRAGVTNPSALVSWSITPNLGSIDSTNGSSVHYTPPAILADTLKVTVSASIGSAKTASLQITLKPNQNPGPSLNPSEITLVEGSAPFGFAVTQNPAEINWSLSPNLGSLNSSTGSSIQYTPPAKVSAPTTVRLQAQVGATLLSSDITLIPGVNLTQGLSVYPSSPNLNYTADPVLLQIAPQNNAAISWSLSPAIGSLSSNQGSSVLYTPPDTVGNSVSVTVTANIAGTSLSAKSTLYLQSPSVSCQSYVATSDNTQISGYTSSISYAPGQSVELKASSPSGVFSVAVYQESLTPRLRYFRDQVAARQQPLPQDPFANDLGWPTSLSFKVGSNWPSGLYNAILLDSAQRCFETIFVVRPETGHPTAPIALLAGNFSWQAYNDWGGASLYTCKSQSAACYTLATIKRMAYIVTNQRPNYRANLRGNTSTDDQFAKGLSYITGWLERSGYPFDLITDSDLEQNPQILDSYKVLVLERHAEYWTGNMYDGLEGFLARGGNLLNLGGNQITWKTVAKNNQLEVRRDRSNHTLTPTPEPGGYWADLGRPQARVLGVRYTSAGIGKTNRSSYTVLNASHWIFQNTQLQNNQTFGEGCSGWETDKIDPQNQPTGLVALARGNNTDPNYATQAGADLVYFTHSGGGGIFSTGSIAFMSEECRRDPNINQILRNVLNRYLGQ